MRLQHLPDPGVAEGTATERDDPGLAAEELGDHRGLDLAKGRLPVLLEQLGDALAAALLHLRVAVAPGNTELSGQRFGQRALAGPHEADEHDRADQRWRHPIRSQ